MSVLQAQQDSRDKTEACLNWDIDILSLAIRFF